MGIDTLLTHLWAAAKRLVFLAILLALYQLFVSPYIEPVKLIGAWVLNMSFFTVIPENAVILLQDVVLTLISFKLLLWLWESPNTEPDKIGSASSVGFSSRRL